MTYFSDDKMNHLRQVIDVPDLDCERYRVIKGIASGGMANIYLAEDLKLNRRVALKVLSHTDESGNLAARMSLEAEVIANLEHPSIVPIHDVGQLGDGRVYYAMKFVEGITFDKYVRQEPSLTEKLRTFQKICEGISFAHAAFVIHRDIKPANVMVGAFGEVLIMDWGIAKLLSSSTRSDSLSKSTRMTKHADTTSDNNDLLNTNKGTLLGTVIYMSPEQTIGESGDVDSRSDIYSLGLVLYYLLTGKEPFENESLPNLIDRIRNKGPVQPRQRNPKIARQLEAICLKATARDKSQRYISASDLSDDISLYLSGEPVTAYPENQVEKLRRWIGKNRLIVLIVIAYIVTRLILFLWFGR